MYNHTFARYYDALTANVNYPARARLFDKLLRKYSAGKPRILLDLACGTGSLSWRFAAMGYEVIGVDASPEMLSIATGKAGLHPAAGQPLFLNQRMEQLDLYGTVDACVCALDSINHLPDTAALQATFARVGMFLAPGGVFAFDVNTRYKHAAVLGNKAYVYEVDGALCVWRNAYSERQGRVDVTLDFFTPEPGGHYRRGIEQLRERIFTHRQLCGALSASGLELQATLAAPTRPGKPAQRIVYAARKMS